MYLKRTFVLLMLIVAFAAAQTDITPPVVVGTEPAHEETGVPPTHFIGVTFNDTAVPPDIPSGVDTSTISMNISYGVESFDVTDDLEFSHPAGYPLAAVYHPTEPFPALAEVTVTLAFADIAGNWADHSFTYTVAGYTPGEDICPPFVEAWLPMGCVYPDSAIRIEVLDNATASCGDPSDLDPTTVHVYANGTDVTSLVTIEPADWPHGHWISFAHPGGFTPGSEVRLCIDGMDNAGNAFEDCHTYNICSDTPLDLCSPVVASWAIGDPCLEPGAYPGVYITDVLDSIECPDPSGVDPASIAVYIDGVNVTPAAYIVPEGPFGRWVEWRHIEPLLAGHELYMCIEFADFAGNIAEACETIYVCDETSSDTCAPDIYFGGTTGTCVEPTHTFIMEITDMIPGCPDSRVDPESIILWHGGTDITAEAEITDRVHDVRVAWTPPEPLMHGSEIQLCVDAEDFEGNHSEDCFIWDICAAPVDECPPIGVWALTPARCIMSGTPVVVEMDDPDGAGCPYSGVDESTIGVWIDGVEVTDDAIIEVRTEDVRIQYSPDWALYEPGDSFHICMDGADFAGNWWEDCVVYHICGDTWEDLCPPVVHEWYPLHDTCITSSSYIGVLIGEDYDSACGLESGLDYESIHFFVNDMDVTGDCLILPEGEARLINWTHPPLEPGTYTFCVTAYDMADNLLEECVTRTVCGEVVTDTTGPEYVSVIPGDDCLTVGRAIHYVINDVSGVELPSIGVWVDDFEVTEFAEIGPAYEPGSAEVTLMLDWSAHAAGDEIWFCLESADIYGNVSENCDWIDICEPDTIDPVDECPPRIFWAIEPGECFTPPLVLELDDLSPECIASTGVDPTSIVLTIGDRFVTDDFDIEVRDTDVRLEQIGVLSAPGTTFELCIHAMDYNDNLAEDCMILTMCPDDTLPPDTLDVCPPEIVFEHAEECVPVDHIFVMEAFDHIPGCLASGIDIESIELWHAASEITADATIYMRDGHAYIEWAAPTPLMPGSEIELCVDVSDLAGNHSEECHIWNICHDDTLPPDTTDTCPPRIFWAWEPGVCLPIDHHLVLELDDLSPECMFQTGIDASSIHLHIGDTDVTESFEIDVREDDVRIEHVGAMLPPGTTFELCIGVMDFADNVATDCMMFTVCPDDTLPPDTTDTCPPVIAFALSPERCIEPDAVIVAEIGDVGPGCIYQSGVDPESIHIFRDDIDVTEWFDIDVRPADVRISAEDHPLFTPGESFVLCVEAADMVGNVEEHCATYTVCVDDTTYTDECPPYLVSWEASECLEPGAPFVAVLADRTGPDCPEASGIDPESIVFTQTHGDMTDEFMYVVDPMGPFSIALGFEVWGGATPGDHFIACLTFADYAGNSVTACDTFNICEDDTLPPDTTDTTPPCVTASWPAFGDTLSVSFIDREGLCFHLSDRCGGSFMASGIDIETIEITTDGVLYTYEELTITHDPVTGELYACIPPFTHEWTEGAHEAQITFSDNAGNSATETIIFVLITETPEDLDPPCYTWPIDDGDTLAAITHALSIDICDICGDVDEFSGVDPESITLIVEHSGATLTPDFELEPNRCGGYTLSMIHGEWEEGTYTICITASDHAGNTSDECLTFVIDEGFVPPEDTAPPCGEWSFEDGATLDMHEMIVIEVCDLCGDTASGVSGVMPEGISLTLSACGEDGEPVPEDWVTISPIYCAGVGIHISPFDGWLDGCNLLCIRAEDEAGNVYEECREFTIDDVPPVDETPPCAEGFYPADGSVVTPPVLHPGLTLCDICGPARDGTGVDPESIIMMIDGVVVDIVTEPLEECMGFEVWYPDTLGAGTHEICVSAMDMAGNEAEYCWSFVARPDTGTTEDEFPPCTGGPYWAGDTIRPDMELEIGFCDLCDTVPHEASGVNPESFEITIGLCGTPGSPLSSFDFSLAPLDCMGYGVVIHPEGGFEAGCNQICISVSDFAGNTFEDCWLFHVEEPIVGEFELISPLCGDHVSCERAPILFRVPTPLPGDFDFIINSRVYDLDSPEVTISGDVVTFTPAERWPLGRVYLSIGDIACFFVVDYRAPELYLLEPYHGAAVPIDLDEIRIGIEDDFSEIDIESIIVFVDGTALTLDSPGVTWTDEPSAGATWVDIVVRVDVEEAGIELTAGESLEICAAAGDLIDVCESNIDDVCWLMEVEEAPRVYMIAGYVTDEETGDPIPDIIVHLAHYYSSGASMMMIDEVETDAEGYFEMEVFPGIFMAGALDLEFDYADEFWNESRSPFTADPIFINTDAPETTWIGFTLEPVIPMELFSVSGTIYIEGDGALAGAHVVAISSDEDEEEWGMVHDVTDSLGQYAMELPRGSYYIMAHRMGFMPGYYGGGDSWEEDAELISVDTDVDGIDIELPLAMPDSGYYRLIITVMEEDTIGPLFAAAMSDSFFPTEPIRGARVTIRNTDDNSYYAGISDYEGGVIFNNIPEGEYAIEADIYPFRMAGGPRIVSLPDIETEETIYLRRADLEEVEESIRTLPENYTIGVYPNPFNSTTNVYFELESQSETSIEVLDVTGRIVLDGNLGVLEEGMHTVELNAKSLTTGIYLVNVRTDRGTIATTQMILMK